MKVIVTTILFIILTVLAAYWWVSSPWVVANADLIDRVLAFLSIVGSILVFLSLILTIHQFRTTQKQEAEKIRSQYIAKIDAVVNEILVNKNVCNEILSKPEYLEGTLMPESKYHIGILEKTLALGSIGDELVRHQLWHVYRLMSVVNSLLGRALDLMYIEHIADPRDEMSRNGRTKRTKLLMQESAKHVTKVASILDDVKPKLEAMRCG